MRKIVVELRQAVPETDEMGYVKNTSVFCTKLRGVLLPLATELAQKQRGYSNAPSFRFYTTQRHDRMLAGNIISYQGREYVIASVADYGKIRDLTLNTVVGTTNNRRVVKSLYY